MIEATSLVRFYLEGIRRWSGARCVSLYAPARGSAEVRALLLHEGDVEPVPELADVVRARQFERELEAGAGAWSPVASAAPGAVLLPMPQDLLTGQDAREEASQDARGRTPRRRQADRASEVGLAAAGQAAWLGLRFDPRERCGTDELLGRCGGAGPPGWWHWMLALGGVLAGHAAHVRAVLNDPVSGLPGRAQLQQSLAEAMSRARARGRAAALLLLNPDDFAAVNERFGTEAGDRVVHELARRLRSALRTSDVVASYGGVMFAALLPNTPEQGAVLVAEKVIGALTRTPYLDGTVVLPVSCGIACFEPANEAPGEPLEPPALIWRADQALSAAKRRGGARAVLWQPALMLEDSAGLDRLTGVFTGEIARDYRHMVLLWDTVSVIAASSDVRKLAAQVLDALQPAFRLDRAALFRYGPGSELELLQSRERGGRGRAGTAATAAERAREADGAVEPGRGAAAATDEPQEPDAEVWSFVQQACRDGAVLSAQVPGGAAAARALAFPALAVPLLARSRCVGCLYVDGSHGSSRLDATDVLFLKALGSQLAMAFDRALLDERDRRRQEQDRQRLEAELEELRETLGQAKLVHRSSAMERVLAAVRRVAPTDATVLITGESGTGKELLARTIHRLSSRRERPLVVVDCSAIAQSLVDSELFGHERGAYTGASQKSIGRLSEAQGGTVLLDEVSELPLEVQAKLLRFLQERQVTSVGATRARQLDVRILAASNRDLEAEVAAGRFRRDLYYRLAVVPLALPPLRERPEDILPLARHFLEQSARGHHKSLRGYSPQAEAALLAYGWPGNVRELQNRVLRAVILCEGDEIGDGELTLGAAAALPEAGSRPPTPVPGMLAQVAWSGPAPVGAQPQELAPAAGAQEPPELLWKRLREALAAQVEARASAGVRGAVPLGVWLEEDLLVEASAAAGGISRRGAALLGVPQTTFRRRLQQTLARTESGLSWRPADWPPVRRLLGHLVRSAAGPEHPALLETARTALLELLAERLPQAPATAAALLGVTEPTYRRWRDSVPKK